MPRPKGRGEPPKADSTMVLYTSLVLILLTFFIMISAKANFDETKYGKVIESVSQAFGPMRGGRSALGADSGLDLDAPDLGAGAPVSDPQMSQIRALLGPGILDGEARIVHNRGQRIITLSSGLLFAQDSPDLLPEAVDLLLSFARVMRDSDIPIAVEGHTDNQPPATEGVGDNWDLSMARAIRVLGLLEGEGGIPPERLSAYGYGGERPLVANNSPKNRARNNRVDLVLDFDQTRAGSLRGLGQEDRSFDFQGFEFDLPSLPGEEGEVY
ncbi:MAG: OmpA family protein [Deltaproteobacteria bacterium]|jgi:chemotaxis protein MotB|nr:OmpA family protein [Deltaproteobacteria bacterium]